jgi:DNA-binding response OmpR family regulator
LEERIFDRIAQPDATATVLDISPFETDHAELTDIFRNSNWNVATSRTCSEAFAFLRYKHIPVVVCESNLPDGSWKDVIDRTARASNPPAVIVTSRLADDRLWSEVLNRGGYNVLLKPFRPLEVLRDVNLAWHDWISRVQHVVRGRKPKVAGGAA